MIDSMWKDGKAPIVPVTILTGFLGSGKTTLLNHILNDQTHGMKFAIIENEFGDVGVDEKVLSANVEEEMIEVMNGCICCTVRGDLITALKELYKKVKSFNGIIIETTGIADPAPVCQTFFIDDWIKERYKLDSVITVVDAKHIMDRLNEQKPEGVENEAVEQVCFADKIFLNKTDLSNDEKLSSIETSLRKLNPNASIQRTMHSKVNPKDVLNIGAFDLDRVLGFDPEFLDEDQEHEHDSSVSSVSIKMESEVNYLMVQKWIQRILEDDGANLYRYKGLIAVKGFEKKFLFQGVGMLFSGGFSDVEWAKDEVRESRFVFIGKNIDHDFYKLGFMACQADKPLRFPIGTVVEANVGEFKKGKIIKHWDEGNAYRIELLDGDKDNIWAPIDMDVYVRPTTKV